MDRILVIEQSFRCLRMGWLSLTPLLGVAFASGALAAYARVFLNTRDEWNPARPHLYGGVFLALSSLLAHSLVIGTIVWGIVQQ